MSKTEDNQSDVKRGRVEVGNLPKQQKELTEKETANIKGGGGSGGGVLGERTRIGERHIGEEIPQ